LLYTANALRIAARHGVGAQCSLVPNCITTADNYEAGFMNGRHRSPDVIKQAETKRREDTVREYPYVGFSRVINSLLTYYLITCLGTRYLLAEIDSSNLLLNGSAVDLLRAVYCFGVTLDQELTFADHIRRLTGRCFHSLRQLRSIRRILTTDTIITLVNALVVSRIDYCNAVLAGVHDVYLRQLQGVVNAAARLIARKRKYDSISATLRDALHWLPIRQRVTLSVLVFNYLHNLAPSYLSTMCQLVADNAGRRHLAAGGDLAVSATTTLRYGPCSFAGAGPSTWNYLAAPIRSCHLTSSFLRDLKTELFIRAYHQYARDCF